MICLARLISGHLSVAKSTFSFLRATHSTLSRIGRNASRLDLGRWSSGAKKTHLVHSNSWPMAHLGAVHVAAVGYRTCDQFGIGFGSMALRPVCASGVSILLQISPNVGLVSLEFVARLRKSS